MRTFDKEKAAELLFGMRDIANVIQHTTGHRPSRSVLWRWHLKGRLRTTRIGNKLFATESAIREMLAQDEQRNRGSAGARGTAAAARHESRLSGRRSA
jgi:hypothetical protein